MGGPILPVTLGCSRPISCGINVKRHKKGPGAPFRNPSFVWRRKEGLLTLPVSGESQSVLTASREVLAACYPDRLPHFLVQAPQVCSEQSFHVFHNFLACLVQSICSLCFSAKTLRFWASGYRSWQPSMATWILILGPMWWKERKDLCKLSFGLHVYMHVIHNPLSCN